MNRRQLGKHDYKRTPDWTCMGGKTFSVGIFEWVPRAGATNRPDNLKPGPAKVRVSGSTQKPELVYAQCEFLCDALDASRNWGWILSKKREGVQVRINQGRQQPAHFRKRKLS